MNDTEGERKGACEVDEVARKFESCELADSEFTHGAHLTVALSYVSRLTEDEATERMRDSLFRFLDYHGGDRQKYNETITRFWIRLVRDFLESRKAEDRTLSDVARELIEKHGNSSAIFKHYSKERLMSDEARSRFIEPDLKPFDF